MASLSVKTIGSPEFLNITSINPLISKCEIKVLYIGENRNRSFISKEVATEMAATLPGTPIVGHYIESKEDFGDHGQQVIIDDEGIKFKTLTTPYGFVAPDSNIWFQKFEETDEFGNTVTREYLMTTGYLWTGQFEECRRVVDGGNPQSMELDENSLKGHWSEDYNRGIEFFIINDAIFSKLCILGEDVEPCFEGACVTAPGATFSKNEGFNKTLYNMMQELKDALKGDEQMEDQIVAVSTEFSENSQDKVDETVIKKTEENIENIVEEVAEGTPEVEVEIATVEEVEEAPAGSDDTSSSEVEAEDVAEVSDDVVADEAAPADDYTKIEENVVDIISEESEDEFACKKKTQCAKEDEEEDKKDTEEEKKETSDETEKSSDDEKKKEDEEEKKKYALLEAQYSELESKYAALEAKYQELESYKASKDNEAKDELISSFSMLTEAEKKDVIDNKTQYSLEDIESKLSVIFARKQRTLEAAKADEEQAPVIYSLEADYSNMDEWVKATLETQKTM